MEERQVPWFSFSSSLLLIFLVSLLSVRSLLLLVFSSIPASSSFFSFQNTMRDNNGLDVVSCPHTLIMRGWGYDGLEAPSSIPCLLHQEKARQVIREREKNIMMIEMCPRLCLCHPRVGCEKEVHLSKSYFFFSSRLSFSVLFCLCLNFWWFSFLFASPGKVFLLLLLVLDDPLPPHVFCLLFFSFFESSSFWLLVLLSLSSWLFLLLYVKDSPHLFLRHFHH